MPLWTGTLETNIYAICAKSTNWLAKKEKSRLLDEAVKRTKLARKVVIRKLRQPLTLLQAVASKPRRRRYDRYRPSHRAH